MQRAAMFAVAVALATSSWALAGEKLVSGPQVGENVTGYFDIEAEKCGGAKDRYAIGSTTRYYWDYCGLVVVVFARTFGDGLASLVKDIDKVIEQNPKAARGWELGAYVSFLGDDFAHVKTRAIEFGKKHTFDHVPLVVPHRFKDGPPQLKIHPDAQVTVIVYKLRLNRVLANHAIAKGSLNEKAIQTVIADIKRHLE